jgi:hypothetical protein
VKANVDDHPLVAVAGLVRELAGMDPQLEVDDLVIKGG